MSKRVHTEPQEPVGIVINAWGREDVAPRFAAFEWGPAPEDEAPPVTVEATAA